MQALHAEYTTSHSKYIDMKNEMMTKCVLRALVGFVIIKHTISKVMIVWDIQKDGQILDNPNRHVLQDFKGGAQVLSTYGLTARDPCLTDTRNNRRIGFSRREGSWEAFCTTADTA